MGFLNKNEKEPTFSEAIESRRTIYNLELNIAGWGFGNFYNLLINNHYTIHFNQCILR